jgi:glycosyltransferase involved in cell wall biosynthesis
MSQPAYDLSVCICTHNPRRHYLARVLAALAAQTLDADAWELVLVDNRSDEPVAGWVDLSAIRHARVVSEQTLGLTNARIKGIRETSGRVMVFVDDDNVLAPDYLAQARRIMAEKTFLGAIGGRCRGEFEATPPEWAWFYFPYLAIADHGDQPLYILHKNSFQQWYPIGAGLVIRREFAEAYAEQITGCQARRMLGRRGTSLASADDIDMVLTVMDGESAIGFCPELILKHLIPRDRVTLPYLKRMIYHANFSLYQLMLTRKIPYKPLPWPLVYMTSIILCLMHRHWHPYTLWLACQAARGRYAAWNAHKKNLKDFAMREQATPVPAESNDKAPV